MVSRVASRAAAAAVGDEPVEQIRTATRTQVPGNHLPAMRQRMILIRMARKVATAARQVRRLNKNTARFPVGKMRSVWLSTQTWKPVRNHLVVKRKVAVGGVAVGLANRDLETGSGGGPAGLVFGRGSVPSFDRWARERHLPVSFLPGNWGVTSFYTGRLARSGILLSRRLW